MIIILAIFAVTIAYTFIGVWLWERAERRWRMTPEYMAHQRAMNKALEDNP